jgi:hypothetical protein
LIMITCDNRWVRRKDIQKWKRKLN